MRRGARRKTAREAGIVGDLDRAPEGLEPRLQVDRDRGRVVERAGVEPQPLDRPGEGAPDRLGDQRPADALPLGFLDEAEEGELDRKSVV